MLNWDHLKGFAPMLGAAVDPHNPEQAFGSFVINKQYPLLVSPKLDGIRIVIHPTLGPVTRTLKPLPNNHIRQNLIDYFMQNPEHLSCLDGEITVGTPENITDVDIFNRTQSAVMSQGGSPIFTYTVFDQFSKPNDPFQDRNDQVLETVQKHKTTGEYYVQGLNHGIVREIRELLSAEEIALNTGYEGLIIRLPGGRYKFGRSTAKEALLIKMKRDPRTTIPGLTTDNALIISAYELMHNDNPAEIDLLGHTKRSSHKANKRPSGMLGGVTVRVTSGVHKDSTVDIGTMRDITHDMRRALWTTRELLPGKEIEFTHQLIGAKDRPRFPILTRIHEDR